MFEIKKMKCTGYGYELENPIKAKNLHEAEKYLNSLEAKDGIVLKWKHLGAWHDDELNHNIDLYGLYVLHLKKQIEFRRYDLLINTNQKSTDTTYPLFFTEKY